MADKDKNQPFRRRRQESEDVEQEQNQVDTEPSTMDAKQDQNTKFASPEDSPADFVIVDTNNEIENDAPLESEASGDFVEVGTDPDQVMAVIDDFTNNEDTLDDFAERQEMAAGSDDLLEKLMQHHSRSPDLTGDDIDASWETANQAGEETVGGSAPTPDQDLVDELGEAMGVTYEDDEELATADKLDARDRARWELDPASAESELDRMDPVEGGQESDNQQLLNGFEDVDEDDELSLLDELEDEADLADLQDLDELDDSRDDDFDLDELDELEDWDELDEEDDL